MLDVLEELFSRFLNLKKRYSTDQYDKLLNPIADLMGAEKVFPNLFWSYFNGFFKSMEISEFKIKKEIEVKKLGDLISNLNLSDESQTMVFHNLSIDVIYEQGIVKPYNFRLNSRSKIIYDFRSTSYLFYYVVLPFYDKYYDPTSTDCTRAEDLPWFFSHNKL